MRFVSFIATVVFLAAAGGCTTVPSRVGFGDVQSAIQDRLSKRIVWNQGTSGDVAVEHAIQSLLNTQLTADDAVQVALLNNPKLQATYEDLGIAQAELVQAGLLRNPVLSFDIQFPGRPHVPIDVGIEQELIDILLMPLRKKIATAQFEQAKARVTVEVIRHAMETRAAFYRLQGGMQMVELRQTVLAAAEARADVAQRMRDAGNINALDLARHIGQRDQASLELADAAAEVQLEHEQLSLLMGVKDGQETWTLAGRLSDPIPENMSLQAMEEQALRERQDLSAARQEVEIAAHLAEFASYSRIFNGSMGVSYARDADVASTVGPSVKIPLPIFDQGQGAASEANARFRQAESRYDGIAREIRAEVRMASSRMASARRRVEFFQHNVLPNRHQIVDEMQLRYNAMLAGVFELLQAKQEEIDAGREYVAALRDYWESRAELQRALGGRLPGGAPIAGKQPTPATSPAVNRDMNNMPGMTNVTQGAFP